MVRVPNLLYKNIYWNSDTISKLSNNLLSIVSKIPGLEDLQSHILFKHHLTPIDLKIYLIPMQDLHLE